MANSKVKNEIELVGTFKKLAMAYQEIAVIKMQRVRDNVISTREFLERLSFVFLDVKKSYKKEIERLLKEKKGGKGLATKYPTNGKTAQVFLASNTKMYGDIINRLFTFFTENINNEQSDIVVIGKLGKELFERKYPGRQYTFFDLPDTGVTLSDLQKIAVFLVNYDVVEVFYGKFENVAKQNPTVFKITGEEELDSNEDEEEKKRVGFFFEPSLDTILTFFQDQVFSSLFHQSVSEGELARFASRIMAMEEALINIEKTEGLLKHQERRDRKLLVNNKQLERLASYTLWR